jgi:Flp pilus assembly protein TadD
LLREQGKLDDAIAEFKRAIEIEPRNLYAHNLLGLTLEQKLNAAIVE